ncbi:fungal hydrophobin [Infundibulicybe gibba]|nr:fungal hydrophobin [Infundibulicybe gibba]
MILNRASTLFFLAILAASPHAALGQQCNTGNLLCCNSAEDSNNPSAGTANLLGLLGIPLASVANTGLIGITCSPISIIGLGSGSCAAQPLCCQNNSFNGVIALGCHPINLGLKRRGV